MLKDCWRKTHEIYSKKSWINDTTIFVQFAVKYFPKNGKLLDLGAGQGQDSRYFASRDLKAGEELFADYREIDGPEYAQEEYFSEEKK